MISNDVFALVQLYPPGIELCRVSNMKNVWTSCAHSFFRRYRNLDGGLAMALSVVRICLGRSALGGTRVIKCSRTVHGRSIAIHHWGAAKYSASRRRIVSLASGCLQYGTREGGASLR